MAKSERMSRVHQEFLRWTSMTTEELAEATKEFDREFIADTFHPLTPEMARLWRKAKHKASRHRGTS